LKTDQVFENVIELKKLNECKIWVSPEREKRDLVTLKKMKSERGKRVVKSL